MCRTKHSSRRLTSSSKLTQLLGMAPRHRAMAQSRSRPRRSSSSAERGIQTTTNKWTVNEAESDNETAPHVSRLVVPSAVSSVPSCAHRTTDSTMTGASSRAAIAGARESSCLFFWSWCSSSCSIKPDEQRLLVSQAATDRHSRIPLTLEPPHTSGSDNDQTKRTADTGQQGRCQHGAGGGNCPPPQSWALSPQSGLAPATVVSLRLAMGQVRLEKCIKTKKFSKSNLKFS